MSPARALRKAKFTVTISDDVARDINNLVKEKGSPRSQVMEEMLREWIREHKRREIDKSIEAYYMSLDAEDEREDKEWADISSQNASGTWDD